MVTGFGRHFFAGYESEYSCAVLHYIMTGTRDDVPRVFLLQPGETGSLQFAFYGVYGKNIARRGIHPSEKL
jgi:hypothetical protein